MWKRLIDGVTGLGEMDAVVREADRSPGADSIFAVTCSLLGLGTVTRPADLNRIPDYGPLIVVANHPSGFAEGLVVPALVDAMRPDPVALIHHRFSRWPALARRTIPVDPQATFADGTGGTPHAAVRYLLRGGCLVVFPAGEVARSHSGSAGVSERPWRHGVSHLALRTKAKVLPIHVSGRTGVACDLMSAVHPRLGAMLLGRELLARRGTDIEVRVGSAILPVELRKSIALEEITDRCRRAVLDLGNTRVRRSDRVVRIRELCAR